MSRKKFISQKSTPAKTLAYASILVLGWAAALAAQTQQNPAALPPGPVQAKATTACTECHEARIIVQQRLSKAAWTKEVDKMIKWGAVVDAADREPLIDYFSTNFPPEKSPYSASRTAATSSKAK